MSWSYLEDASGAKGHAEKICIPGNEAELLAILAEANEAKIPVTIAGGGSGLTGGRVPFGGWQISMEKFRRLDIHDGFATVGSGVTLGAASFVHYGVTIGDGAVLAPDSFIMKGTEVPTRARWQGNPAREVAVGEAPKVRMRI